MKAYRLADNRVHEEAEWDEELLALELGDLSKLGFNLEATGFDADEINALSEHRAGRSAPGRRRGRGTGDAGEADDLSRRGHPAREAPAHLRRLDGSVRHRETFRRREG